MATTRKEETQRRLIEARTAKKAAAEAANKAMAEQYETWLRERDAMALGRHCATFLF